MAKQERHKTKYPGVIYVDSTCPATGKQDRLFYIRYRREGKLVEEKAGRQRLHSMTAAKASQLRSQRMLGAPTNTEKRKEQRAKSERWTFNRLWEVYLEHKAGSHKSRVQDVSRYDLYIRPHFGDREPSEVCALDVERFRRKACKGLSPGAVRNVLEMVRRIANFGTKMGFCKGLGFKVVLPKANCERTEDLTREEAAALRKAIDEHPNQTHGRAVKLAMVTGLRRGEIAKLKWDDVDFVRGFIWLRDPKSGRDQKIPMGKQARAILEQQQQFTETAYTFDGVHKDTLTAAARRMCDAAGLPRSFRPMHGLRHAFASALASSGKVDMYTLQKLLTHSSPTMTQRYAHLRDESLQQAAGVADDIFSEEDNTNVVDIQQARKGAGGE